MQQGVATKRNEGLGDGRPRPVAPYKDYVLGRAYDEMFAADGRVRPHCAALHRRLSELPSEELTRRQQACEQSFLHQGITFTVYSDNQATERIIPTDLLPRIVTGTEWVRIEAGLKQRILTLNLFLRDIYSECRVLKDGIVPRSLIYGAKHYRREMRGLAVPHGAYVNVCGTDRVRCEDGRFVVLEDNLRVPSGVSYMLANREVVRRAFPGVFRSAGVQPIEHYPQELLATLKSLAPYQEDASIAVLTPGVYNAAYFEHAFLARQMGVELVEGRDLVCRDGVVRMRTTAGEERGDVGYRRVADEFLDALHFRPDSLVGCPGILNAARVGNVTIANAVGNGVADDKLTYTYMPDIIRYYLGEHPLLPNVQTYRLEDADHLAYVLERIDQLVLKPVAGSGGYGILIGPQATDRQLTEARAALVKEPRAWTAQEIGALSTAPTWVGDRLAPRHLDLRPFAVNDGEHVWVLPGGLSRVALPEGSLVVNSS